MRFFEYITKIIYINLDHRTDRNNEINAEFERIGIPKEKILRLSAIHDNNGAMGCTKSHIAVLELAKKNKYENVLILEDDFNFIKNIDKIDSAFTLLFSKLGNIFDGFQMSRGYKYEKKENICGTIFRTDECSTTSGYLVSNRIYDKLLQNYKKGLLLYKSNPEKTTEFSLDVYWKNVQKTSNWYVSDPFLGYQRTSYSDIGNIYINYSSVNGLEEQHEKYVSIQLCGGLGNQLFQIAALYSTATEYNMIPIVKDIKSSQSVFENRPVYFSSILKKIKNIHPHYYESIKFEIKKEKNYKYELINIDKNDKSYQLEGYYQSYKYFEKYRNVILELFDMGNEIEEKIKSEFKKISNNTITISIHVRRGDYLKLSDYHLNLPLSYYKTAIDYMNADDVTFLIFSDDIEWCKENFKGVNNIFITGNYGIDFLPEEVVQLKFMSLCNHNVIANSSFSWWGAWLNKNEDKVIIAPKKWFSKDDIDTSDLLPEEWKKISVDM
ncbi:alpha-1,2-fucosyltransferase [Bodo saltans virus]|uniref:Alpha-1,2-fucosyltransferase n=1 Tax=Bodo saltans virus TaxID=2024608 RepID=A0A2H4UUT1_9VIRU|nr:alpha-1,2-fucosyltransferase [Bodo saltans virus]ATZ80616.1 alpha-1,2-fucosyltransferase [Bodo saltans virus]